VTGGDIQERSQEFFSVMKHLNVLEFEMWNFEMSLQRFSDKSEIIEKLTILKNEHDWDKILTHSRYGEYGNMQHIELHEMVVNMFRVDKIYVYNLSEKFIGEQKSEDKLDVCKIYKSQYIFGTNQIKVSTCGGSDWYKHTVGFNLMDFEQVVPLLESLQNLSIAIIDPEIQCIPRFLMPKLSANLSERGHSTFVKTVHQPLEHYDVTLVLLLSQAIELADKNAKYVFVFMDSIQNIDLTSLNYAISKSVRTLFVDPDAKTYVRNPLNSVRFIEFEDWYKIIRRLESNMLMGLKWYDLNKFSKPFFINAKLEGDKFKFDYNFDYVGDTKVVLYNEDHSTLSYYNINLDINIKYWIQVNPDWFSRFVLVSIFSMDGTLLSSQEFPPML
jgi:hypothetical protein